jgi:hypothetical protein
MADKRWSKATLITSGLLLGHLLATVIATGLIWVLGNWQAHEWGLTLALRIIWGVWIVHFLALMLTRATIFGWKFRRYFRWPESAPTPPPRPTPLGPLRAARAPWGKSGAMSFSSTVVLVSATGAIALTSVVMWILSGVTGNWVFWVVTGSLWSAWWVLCIVMVLTRIVAFGVARQKALREARAAGLIPSESGSGAAPQMSDKRRDGT